MSKFNAGSLNIRNAGSRIGFETEEEEVYGVIASIRQNKTDGHTAIYLTDSTDPYILAPTQEVDIQITAAELATLEIGNAVGRIEEVMGTQKRGRR